MSRDFFSLEGSASPYTRATDWITTNKGPLPPHDDAKSIIYTQELLQRWEKIISIIGNAVHSTHKYFFSPLPRAPDNDIKSFSSYSSFEPGRVLF